MKTSLTMSVLACLLVAASVLASSVRGQTDLSAALAGLEGLRIERNETFEANYPGTQCIDVSLVSSGDKAGLICRSRNKKFIEDMGIVEFNSLPETSRPKVRPASGLVVATPMAQYSMSLMAGTKGRVAAAMVDCDAGAGTVYRATATCHVAVSSPPGEEVLYSNVTVKNHADGRAGLTLARIREIWRRLEIR